jgi:hypothetical protein
MAYETLIDGMFEQLVEQIRQNQGKAAREDAEPG